MASTEVEIIIDAGEVREACAVLRSWAGRTNELPIQLRRQLEAVLAQPEVLAGHVVAQTSRVYEVALTHELRALVGNLRAREDRPT